MNDNNSINIKENISNLSDNIVPDENFVKEIEECTPCLSEELIRLYCNEVGLNSSDSRVYKLIALDCEKMIKNIIEDTANVILSKKSSNKFLENKELVEVLINKGYKVNKNQFFSDNIHQNLENKYK